MKFSSLLLAAVLAAPVSAFAADAVNIEIYLAGELKQSVALVGPNSIARFSPPGLPDTTIELRLIAPAPVIVNMKETTTDGAVVERIKMPQSGSKLAVSEIKGAKFHNAYVLVSKD